MKTKKDLNKEVSEYYTPPKIKLMLEKAKKQVTEKDWDRVYLIDGGEGSGKSLLGLQLACSLDSTMNLDRVTFTGEGFSKAINEAQKGQCVIFDEAFNGLSSSGAASKMNRFIVRKLMECRQKNLFLIIILPTFFLLQKYAAIFRSKCLFHVYSTKKGVRGYYRVYNELNKKRLFLNGQKFYSYAKPYIKYSFRFYGKYPSQIDEAEYRKKKHDALLSEEEETKLDKYALRFALFGKLLKEKFKMPYSEQLKYLEGYKQHTDKAVISRLIALIPSN